VAGGQHRHLVRLQQQAPGSARAVPRVCSVRPRSKRCSVSRLEHRRLQGVTAHAGLRVRRQSGAPPRAAAHAPAPAGRPAQPPLRKLAQRLRGGGDALQPDVGALDLLAQRQRAHGGRRRPRTRSNRRNCSTCSSRASSRLTVGCEVCSNSAARVTLAGEHQARKTSIWRWVSVIAKHIISTIGWIATIRHLACMAGPSDRHHHFPRW
jgi:hypothetical protein